MTADIKELEQMREDYAVLKSKFDKQEILNDKLLREAMRTRVGSIKNVMLVDVCCAAFVTLTAPYVFHYNPVINASWAFVAATILMMMVCIFFDFKYNSALYRTDLSNCDLLSFSKKVAEIKKKFKGWVKYGISIGLVWFIWLAVEILTRSEDKKIGIIMICGLTVGLITGGALGIHLNHKIVRTCEDIIRQIEMN